MPVYMFTTTVVTSSHQEVSIKKAVHKNFTIFTEKHIPCFL